jgi:hypothetical protein
MAGAISFMIGTIGAGQRRRNALKSRIHGHDIAMPHKVSTLVAWVLVALSIFFVFRPQQPLNRLQPPHKMLSAKPCGAHPETSSIPAEYSCETP